MFKAKAKVNLKTGDLLSTKIKNAKKGDIIVWPYLYYDEHTLIGVAARNIKKGEIIEYCPFCNTKDIIIKGIAKLKRKGTTL